MVGGEAALGVRVARGWGREGCGAVAGCAEVTATGGSRPDPAFSTILAAVSLNSRSVMYRKRMRKTPHFNYFLM